MAGLLANSLGNMLWNGKGYMSATPSTGAPTGFKYSITWDSSAYTYSYGGFSALYLGPTNWPGGTAHSSWTAISYPFTTGCNQSGSPSPSYTGVSAWVTAEITRPWDRRMEVSRRNGGTGVTLINGNWGSFDWDRNTGVFTMQAQANPDTTAMKLTAHFITPEESELKWSASGVFVPLGIYSAYSTGNRYAFGISATELWKGTSLHRTGDAISYGYYDSFAMLRNAFKAQPPSSYTGDVRKRMQQGFTIPSFSGSSGTNISATFSSQNKFEFGTLSFPSVSASGNPYYGTSWSGTTKASGLRSAVMSSVLVTTGGAAKLPMVMMTGISAGTGTWTASGTGNCMFIYQESPVKINLV